MPAPTRDKKLLSALRHIALAKCYSVRDAQVILNHRGFYAPSVEFIWKYFRKVRNRKPRR